MRLQGTYKLKAHKCKCVQRYECVCVWEDPLNPEPQGTLPPEHTETQTHTFHQPRYKANKRTAFKSRTSRILLPKPEAKKKRNRKRQSTFSGFFKCTG